MKLQEAFDKYPDTQKMRRQSYDSRRMSYDIGWLKGMHAWGNEESRRLGFFIFPSMIEDAQADDWEPVNET
jgi:hypothetical protein